MCLPVGLSIPYRVTGASTVPIDSTTARTSSPGSMCAAPGVPVLNRSPGSSVITSEWNETISDGETACSGSVFGLDLAVDLRLHGEGVEVERLLRDRERGTGYEEGVVALRPREEPGIPLENVLGGHVDDGEEAGHHVLERGFFDVPARAPHHDGQLRLGGHPLAL